MINNDNIINMTSINNIKQLQRPEMPNLIHRVIDIFVNEATGKIQEMDDAYQAKDMEKIAFVAHALKSSSGNLGALRLSGVCEQLELKGKTGDFDGITEVMPTFKIEYQKAQDVLIQIKSDS